jgi:hypothetical protein
LEVLSLSDLGHADGDQGEVVDGAPDLGACGGVV